MLNFESIFLNHDKQPGLQTKVFAFIASVFILGVSLFLGIVFLFAAILFIVVVAIIARLKMLTSAKVTSTSSRRAVLEGEYVVVESKNSHERYRDGSNAP